MLLGVLFVRHRAKSFPVFTAWMIFNVLRNIVLYLIFRYARHSYFYSFWALGAIDVSLQCAIFFAMTRKVFSPLGTWAPDVRRGLQIVVLGSLIVASLFTWMDHPAATSTVKVLVSKGNFFSSALLSELFLGTLILSSWAGLPWKTHVARISQGLGVFSAVGLITQGAHTQPSNGGASAAYFFWSHIEISCYLCCLLYWIVTLWQEAEAPRELPDKIREELAHLNRLLGGGALGKVGSNER